MNTTPTTAAGNAERSRFEAWAKSDGYDIDTTPGFAEYFDLVCQRAWEAWQARAALSPGNAEAAGGATVSRTCAPGQPVVAIQPAPETTAPQGLREAALEAVEVMERAKKLLKVAGFVVETGTISHPYNVAIEKLRSAALAPYVTAQPAPSPAREEGATPVTDAYAYDSQPGNPMCPGGVMVVPREISRQLERERDTARKSLAEARAETARMRSKADECWGAANYRLKYIGCLFRAAGLDDSAPMENRISAAAEHIATLRTLADELAGYIQTRKKKLATELHAEVMAGNVVKEYAARSAIAELTALESFRSSTPAPAPAPDKLKETNL